VFLLRAEPGTDEGARLLGLVLGLGDPWVRVRWVAESEVAGVARRFGVEIEAEPALYLVRGHPSGALRDADVFREVWRGAAADASR
jgi:hypothetical protein